MSAQDPVSVGRYGGVDPGLSGAIAILDDAGKVLDVIPTPLVLATSKGGRDQYDLVAIREVLRRQLVAGDLFVTVEKLAPMPMKFARKGQAPGEEGVNVGGTIANFNRGLSRGWAWMLTALGIPYQLVSPQSWQRAMFVGTPEGDPKQRSVLAAKMLWPTVDLRRTERARKDSPDIADALLLAEHGRRTHKGGEMFARAEGA